LKNIFSGNKNSFSAFGSLISYLRVLKLDQDLLSYGDVSLYEIMEQSKSMIVDGQAVEHLSVCNSGQDQRNTLFGTIDRCSTPFGHRRLRSWLMHPLYIACEIKSRQDAVTCLVENFGSTAEITKSLKNLPDLERLCTRIHARTLPIKSFVYVLNGFKTIQVCK
jgi:DNA mismatch repair protein MSH6